jgi:hypothetical protein
MTRSRYLRASALRPSRPATSFDPFVTRERRRVDRAALAWLSSIVTLKSGRNRYPHVTLAIWARMAVRRKIDKTRHFWTAIGSRAPDTASGAETSQRCAIERYSEGAEALRGRGLTPDRQGPLEARACVPLRRPTGGRGCSGIAPVHFASAWAAKWSVEKIHARVCS